MTTREKAEAVISNWKSFYKPVTEDYIQNIDISNYKQLQAECDQLKIGLDKVDIQVDYTDVDNIYKLVYSNEYRKQIAKYHEELKELRLEALTKQDVLNKPINEKWDADYRYYKRLKTMQDNLNQYNMLLTLYAKYAKISIKPISEINLDYVANKISDYNKLIKRFKVINDVINKNVLALNVSIIGLLLLLSTLIGSIIIAAILIAATAIIVSTVILLKNNEDLISFVIQEIKEPNKDDYKRITFENSPGEFLDIEQKQTLINDMINSKEVKELYEKSQGLGKELYEEEYKEYIDEYQEEYYKQVELQKQWQENLDKYKEEYKNSIVYLGDKYSLSYKMDYNIQLGMDKETGEPYTVNIKDKIIVISDLDTNSKEDILRLWLLGIISNVRYTNIAINVYDNAWKLTPYQPIDFNIQKDNSPIVNMINQYTDFKNYCDEMNNKATVAMGITRKLVSIDTYNENADKDINANIQYNICISAVTQSDNSCEATDSVFLSMLKYTMPFGFIHIILCEDPRRLDVPFEKLIIKGG